MGTVLTKVPEECFVRKFDFVMSLEEIGTHLAFVENATSWGNKGIPCQMK